MKKKNLIRKIIGLILIAAGLGILLSSVALNVRQYYSKQETIRDFNDSIAGAESVEESDAQENTSLAEDVLYILRIPAIDSENPVREGVSKSVLSDALGHESGTAFAGETGNCVIAGHRNYTFGKFFNRLDEVKLNDLIYLDSADGTYTYEVKDIKVVEPDDLSVLDPVSDREQLTLYTCTPIYVATQRLVIIAERVQN